MFTRLFAIVANNRTLSLTTFEDMGLGINIHNDKISKISVNSYSLPVLANLSFFAAPFVILLFRLDLQILACYYLAC